MAVESGPAERIEGGRDGLRPEDHARSAAVRRVVDAPMPPEPPAGGGRGPGRRRGRAPASGPGCSPRAAPRASREEADDVDLEGHVVAVARGSADPSLRRRGLRALAVARPARAPRARVRPWRGRVDRRAAEIEDGLVDDDLAALRREGRDDVADRRHVELADRARRGRRRPRSRRRGTRRRPCRARRPSSRGRSRR